MHEQVDRLDAASPAVGWKPSVMASKFAICGIWHQHDLECVDRKLTIQAYLWSVTAATCGLHFGDAHGVAHCQPGVW